MFRNVLYCLEATYFDETMFGGGDIPSYSNIERSETSFCGYSETLTPYTPNPCNADPSFDVLPFCTTRSNDNLSPFEVQQNIVNFIIFWMQKYWKHDFDANLILDCNAFIARIRRVYECNDAMTQCDIERGLALAKKFETALFSHQNGQKKKKKSSFCGVSRRKHQKSKSLWNIYGGFGAKNVQQKELCNVDCLMIAQQITICFYSKFKCIHPRECLKQRWKEKDKKNVMAPNITAYIDTFNKFVKWIKSSILLAENVKMRAKIIKKWIGVQQELYKLHNFQAIAAVFTALESNPIYKLKRAWSHIPKKQKKQHENIKKNLMCHSNNYKKLRQLQNECQVPMIPYFPMFAQDLIFIEETTKNRRSFDGSINWQSLGKLNNAINEHLMYQRVGYDNLSSDESMQKWMNIEMNTSAKLNDEWLFKVSQNVAIKDEQNKNKNKGA